MRMGHIGLTGLMGLMGLMGMMLVVTATIAAEPYPIDRPLFQSPIRHVGEANVSLKPLIEWWQLAEAEKDRPHFPPTGKKRKNDLPQKPSLPPRPLTSWVRIKGKDPKVVNYGWVMEAQIQDRPEDKLVTQKIYLRHPPIEDKQRLAALRSRYQQLAKTSETNFQISDANRQTGNELNSKAMTLDTVASAYNYQRQGINRREEEYNAAAAKAFDKSQTAGAIAVTASREKAEIMKEMRRLGSVGDYRLDRFAMRTGEKFQGLPVFEFGQVFDWMQK